MSTYNLKISTGTDLVAGTINQIYIALVGLKGESVKHKLSDWKHTIPGVMTEFEIDVGKDLGDLLLIRVTIDRVISLCTDAWYCNYINVTSPSGQLYQFPLYQWLTDQDAVEIPEGKGVVLYGNVHPLLRQQRKKELEENRSSHQWRIYAEGAPHCIHVIDDDPTNLPSNDRFSITKYGSFAFTYLTTELELLLKGFKLMAWSWSDLEDIRDVSWVQRSNISDVVYKMWKEDFFFGYQFLNGVNPLLIRKCYKIPENLPVGEDMLAPILGSSTNLQKELEKGHLFVADYKILQGVPANSSINDKLQYMAAPICLLWLNPRNQLVPVAIQLSQTPGEDAPIFLPTDAEHDWLLAKMWVRNSDFQVHEAISHLLYTHLFAEVFNIATTRQLPMGHPIHKLIVPHLRYTLPINMSGRRLLIGPGGIFDDSVAIGKGAFPILLRKAMEEITYSKLCLPDDIIARGMEDIPNYLYRDDGMKIWAAIESFVSKIVHYYYQTDEMVRGDPELQAWVAEIFTEGFLGYTFTGIPSSLESKASLIKYLAMVIFTCSGLHAAVNSGQFDFYSWMPNAPSSMKSPPPTAKGVTTMQTILDTLPDKNTTAKIMSTLWLLSHEPHDRRRLGDYRDVRFTEETPQKYIKEFQEELAKMSEFIQMTNETMWLPYPYLDPGMIENSISI